MFVAATRNQFNPISFVPIRFTLCQLAYGYKTVDDASVLFYKTLVLTFISGKYYQSYGQDQSMLFWSIFECLFHMRSGFQLIIVLAYIFDLDYSVDKDESPTKVFLQTVHSTAIVWRKFQSYCTSMEFWKYTHFHLINSKNMNLNMASKTQILQISKGFRVAYFPKKEFLLIYGSCPFKTHVHSFGSHITPAYITTFAKSDSKRGPLRYK